MKYNKQRNLCASITRKTKRSYYENLDLKDINDSKKILGYSEASFLKQDKVNRIHHSRRKWKTYKQ